MLKDIYYAENKILKMLPKMADAAQSKELRLAFQKHEKETKVKSSVLSGFSSCSKSFRSQRHAMQSMAWRAKAARS
jgi:ferritin-like metal-binding protein YciE